MGVADRMLIPGCGPRIRFSSKSGKVGLKNIGNDCFMNTGLQCLCHIEPLVRYFLSGDFRQEVNVTNPLSHNGEIAKAFADLVKALWQSDQSVYDPRTFRRLLSRKAPHLFEGDEQDVQEFLAFCIDGLHEDLNRVPRPPAAIGKEQEKKDERMGVQKGDDFAAALAWLRHLQRGQSFLVDLLQGQLRSSLTCSRCKHTSKCFDPFLYLSLPVSKTMTQVTDALAEYLTSEKLTGDEQWHCERCKKKVDATKKIDLWKLPPVLVLHLKRFEFDQKTAQFQKTENRLSMKLTNWDLGEFCSSPQRDGSTYSVACVANHSGAFGSGHYTATCRVGGMGSHSWFHFSDAKVKAYDGRNVVTRESYVIFLVRNQASPTGRYTQPQGTPLLRQQSLLNPSSWPHAEHAVNEVLSLAGCTQKRHGPLEASPPEKKQKTLNAYFTRSPVEQQ